MGINKPLDSIEESDLLSLANQVSEKKTIEYKSALPGNTHDEKKEFLADVSSFANATGGDLIFGIKEKDGVPVEVCGLGSINSDAEILRMENMIRNNIEPRIIGVSMQPVPLQGSNAAIIIRVPRSWAQPHVVSFEKHWRFYSRNSAGKYPLDVSEVRAAFALSESIGERIRLFRAERLGKIIAGETPVMLPNEPKAILHLIPFGAFDPAVTFNLSSFGDNDWWQLIPIGLDRANWYRYNLDGIVSYLPADRESTLAQSYLQVFRNGTIEAVTVSKVVGIGRQQEKGIDGNYLELVLLDALPKFLSIQKRLGVELPLFVMLSLLGVSNYLVTPSVRDAFSFVGHTAYPIDRDSLLLPEVMVDSYESDPDVVMKPVFDALWNSGGWPRSMYYGEDGRRIRKSRQ